MLYILQNDENRWLKQNKSSVGLWQDLNASYVTVRRFVFICALGAIHKYQHFHECTNHTLSETPSPPKKKSTHQHFLSAKNRHENNKNKAKKLKVYGKNVDFHRPPTKVYGLYTRENVDICGQPLRYTVEMWILYC